MKRAVGGSCCLFSVLRRHKTGVFVVVVVFVAVVICQKSFDLTLPFASMSKRFTKDSQKGSKG